MRLLSLLLLASPAFSQGFGQGYTLSTFAGGGLPSNILGSAASFGAVGGIAVDSFGNVFIANGQFGRVLRLDAVSGILTVVAGNGTHGFSGDGGTGPNAQLMFPSAVAVDSSGNVYIADGAGERIRKVSNGIITTLAGNGTQGYTGDNGPATSAQFNFPTALAVDPNGPIYVADTNNNVIRKIANGVITTIAGGGSQLGDNGPPTSAMLQSPAGIALDSSGNMYIAEQVGNRIRKISNGTITTIAGNGTAGFSGDNGAAIAAKFNNPQGLVVDPAGNVYIADVLNNRIRKISNGNITTAAGTGVQGFGGDGGTATSALLNGPSSVGLDSLGNLYLTDSGNHRIREIAAGVITTIAGGGTQVGDGSPATSAQLAQPTDVTVDAGGIVYIADSGDAAIRKVSNGLMSNAAGNGIPGFAGENGAPGSAELSLGTRSGVLVDAGGNLYICDSGNNRVRKVSNGAISTIAGTGVAGFGGDGGQATSAQLNAPTGIAIDSSGNLYIADSMNNRIRRVSSGVISTQAGNGTAGFSGDNGPANAASLNVPLSVAVDTAGNVYIGDSGNYRVRKVSNGVITTMVGNGVSGFSGDGGLSAGAQVGAFPAVALDSAGSLLIADFGNGRIRKISANGIIATIAGTGASGFSGDGGPATSGQFASPAGIAIDSAGRIYVADQGNNRIRLLTPATVPCDYIVSPVTLQISGAGGNVTTNIGVAAGCPWTVSGLASWLSLGATLGTGSATVSVTAAANTGAARTASILVAGTSVNINQAAAPPSSPVITSVVNGASFLSGIAPDSYITITGANLSSVTDDWSNSILNGVLPIKLHDVSVSINGQPAYVEFVSPTQINAVAPDIGAGSFPVTVTNSLGTSTPVTTSSLTFAPAFFLSGSYVVATHQDFSVAAKNGTFSTPTVAAKPGDVIILWGTGFGPTTPAAPVGAVVPATSLLLTANTVTVTVGGAPATVYYAVLAPGFASEFQVAIQIPPALGNGDYQVVATVGGVHSPSSSTTGLITVQQ